jgi:hypothetical protein
MKEKIEDYFNRVLDRKLKGAAKKGSNAKSVPAKKKRD